MDNFYAYIPLILKYIVILPYSLKDSKQVLRYWNNDRIVIRLKMPPNQFVQIWRQESKLI
ncbi:hypothetical protein [Spiroplasma endosymbiont of Notiophilus biguttatus]|uniref:hypothetical protein n=1 Tax=Spiroplasma endosymbiont of Notiophilus biguttatus TaxID=3066285 RepID=UPI00313CA8B0